MARGGNNGSKRIRIAGTREFGSTGETDEVVRGSNNGSKRSRIGGSREFGSTRETGEVLLNPPTTIESRNQVPLTSDARGSLGQQTPQPVPQQAPQQTPQQAPTLSPHRPFIFPYKDKFTDPKVAKLIISDFKGMFSGPWTRWTDVPKKHRNLMFVSFERTYQWDPSLDTIVRENWEAVIKKRYSDIMVTVREDAVKMAIEEGVNVRDMSDVKPFFPDWIDEHDFAKMIDDVWNTSKWKHVSESGKQNRATLVEGQMSRHSGGSLSFDHHQLRMEKEKGGPVAEVEVYKKTHTKKGEKGETSEAGASASTEYTTLWAGMVLEAYLELATVRFGPDRDAHPKRIDRELWEQACGGMKKGTLFGISNDKRELTTSRATGISDPHMGGASADELQSMKQQLEEHKREAEEFRREAEELRREAEVRATQVTQLQEQERQTRLEVQEMNGQLAAVTRILNEKFPPSG